MNKCLLWLAGLLFLVGGCSSEDSQVASNSEDVESQIFATHDAIIDAMVAGDSTAQYHTGDWSGVNLNGTPMSASGFEGEDRSMGYERIELIDRNVRVYGDSAALRWHAHFYVTVNGHPSYAEMRILDTYVFQDGKWVNDLTQVTPIHGTVGNPPEDAENN